MRADIRARLHHVSKTTAEKSAAFDEVIDYWNKVDLRTREGLGDFIGIMAKWSHLRDYCQACNGSGDIVLNPEWPNGDLPHIEKCSECGGSGFEQSI